MFVELVWIFSSLLLLLIVVTAVDIDIDYELTVKVIVMLVGLVGSMDASLVRLDSSSLVRSMMNYFRIRIRLKFIKSQYMNNINIFPTSFYYRC